ncbi:MAG: hypothetical protein ACOYXA_01100 [Bacteroidota bacterium]
MKTTIPSQKPLLASLADRLLEAQRELDELAVQYALGKAEARDAFAGLKIALRAQYRLLKSRLAGTTWTEELAALQARFEALEKMLQRTPEKTDASTWRAAEERLAALQELVSQRLREAPGAAEFLHEIEKLKLRMELLRLKLALKKIIVQEDVRAGIQRAVKKTSATLKNLNQRIAR